MARNGIWKDGDSEDSRCSDLYDKPMQIYQKHREAMSMEQTVWDKICLFISIFTTSFCGHTQGILHASVKYNNTYPNKELNKFQ